MLRNRLFSIILVITIGAIYRSWFIASGTLAGGDWPYLFRETIHGFSFIPDPHNLWLGLYYQIPTKIFVEYFHFPWELVERLLWFWPFIIISIVSSYYLFRSWIGVLIYTTNTYILMVVGGGQMGVALAYSLAPLVLYRFMVVVDFLFQGAKPKVKSIGYLLVTGLILSIHVMFDPRIAYITGIAILLYWFYSIISHKNNSLIHVFKISGYLFAVPIIITLLVNIFWITPLIMGNISFPVGSLGSLSGFKFLSFTDFSHALSLLHPNWPENIFGKIYFLQPEFLILPAIAFLSLFFVSNAEINKKRTIIYFAFLAFLGIFLAKGTNPPFGEVNIWIFGHIPGMSIFRDASKFYLLIVLGYAFLISWGMEKLFQEVKFKKIFMIVFILFWCFTVRQAILGELRGTFKPSTVPTEYISLKQFLLSQPNFTSSVWIPSRQRFGFSSSSHLGISASDILGSSDPLLIARVISNNKDSSIYKVLKKMNVGQVIVPYDSGKELFIVDRKYSSSLRDKVIMELDKTVWLIKLTKLEETVVYRVR